MWYRRQVNGRRAWTGAIKSKTTGRRRYLKVRRNGGGWRFWMPIVDESERERSRRTEKGKITRETEANTGGTSIDEV